MLFLCSLILVDKKNLALHLSYQPYTSTFKPQFIKLNLVFLLGGDSAVKLLTKFGLLETAIDYAADNGYV